MDSQSNGPQYVINALFFCGKINTFSKQESRALGGGLGFNIAAVFEQ